jgi:hypothetical protein
MNTLNIYFYLKIVLVWSFEVDHSESIRDSAMSENRGGCSCERRGQDIKDRFVGDFLEFWKHRWHKKLEASLDTVSRSYLIPFSCWNHKE